MKSSYQKMALLLIVSVMSGLVISAAVPEVPETYREVTVEAHDTLWSIAARQIGDDQDIRPYVYRLQEINHISNPGDLHAGQVIRVPAGRKK